MSKMSLTKRKCFFMFLNMLLVGFHPTPSLMAQDSDTIGYDGIVRVIYLDSFVVKAKREGFDTEKFIQLVQEDETFYQAFRNLRFVNYDAQNTMAFYNKKGKEVATHFSKTRQWSDGECRIMSFTERKETGNFYKRKDYRYYTAKLFDKVFFTHDTICDDPSEPAYNPDARGIDKHYQELKKLIFEPGTEVKVPFIGDRMALFDEDMSKYYDFGIRMQPFLQTDCYVFTAKVKPEYQDRKERRTIIKYMETYFEKATYQVIGRNYHLVYQGPFFDFDVTMNIELKKVGNQYVPQKVHYLGTWDIPLKKPETAEFQAKFFNFH